MQMHLFCFKVLRKLRAQIYLNWTATVHVVSFGSLHIPLRGIRGGELLDHLGQAAWKTDLFKLLGHEICDAYVLDVGANLGYTLLDLLRAGVSPKAYLAFEPNPACIAYLEQICEQNRFEFVRVFPFALSSQPECRILEMIDDIDSGASIVANLRIGRSIERRKPVPCFSLDSLVDSGLVVVSDGFFMKIDVEGSEVEVVEGAKDTISTFRPIIQCEVLWPHSTETLEMMRQKNNRLMTILKERDYHVFQLKLARNQQMLEGILRIGVFPEAIYSAEKNEHECDYLFVPAERSQSVESRIHGLSHA